MNGAPRKRHHAGRDERVEVVRTPSHKKARTLITPQTAPRIATSRRSHSRHQQHQVTNPESEEIEEEEEEGIEAEEVARMHSQDTEEEEEGAMPLVVFQCSTCRSIFGDSYAFVSSTEQLWLVTLSHVTNVTLAPEVQTANTKHDAGSSYVDLLCQNCQAVLGRKYLTTPVALDGIRDLFSFSTEAITSYTLGDPMQKADKVEDKAMTRSAAACHETMQNLAIDRDEVAKLRDEMEKVKGLLVTVDDRLAHLEGAEPESEGEAYEPSEASRWW